MAPRKKELREADAEHAPNASKRRLMELTNRITTFRQAMLPEVTGALNDYLCSQTPKSAEDKKRLASYVTQLIRQLGFSIEHSGQRCSLYAVSGKHDPNGRFRIQPLSSKRPLAHSANLQQLLPLRLTDEFPQRNHSWDAPSGEDTGMLWQNRTTKGSSSYQER